MQFKNRVSFKRYSALILFSVGSTLAVTQVFASPVGLKGYVMTIQMTPAVCEIDSSLKKKRKCLEGYSLNIMGLMPETNQSDCATLSSAKLSPLQSKVVASVMPDEYARNSLWANIGGCVPLSASQYFRDIIKKAEQLKIPNDLSVMGTKDMTLISLRNQFLKLNSSLTKDAIRFSCQKHKGAAMLTDIHVCYTTKGRYKQCPSQMTTTCPSVITIKGAY